MNRFFKVLVAALVLVTAAWAGPRGRSTDIEKYLREGHEFSIPSNQNVAKYLLKLVEEKKHELKNVGISSRRRDSLNLRLGDLYHWLGHVADEREDLDLAEKYHRRSLFYYRRSNFQSSTKINRLNGVDHALHHLDHTRLSKKLAEWRASGKTVEFITGADGYLYVSVSCSDVLDR